MNDKNNLDLNDHFAIAAMQSLMKGKEGAQFAICENYILGYDSYICDQSIEAMKRMAIVAYKMAHEMRKARLAVFE